MNITDIRIPEKLTEENLLSLLTEDIPIMDSDEIDRVDFAGKDANRDRDIRSALVYRLIAALGYEARHEQFGEDTLYRAAYSYDRASKNAFQLKFNMLAFRCAFRASHIHNELFKSNTLSISANENLEYACNRVNEAFKKIMKGGKIKNIYGNDEEWFPESVG
jgi:hypothetical protein